MFQSGLPAMNVEILSQFPSPPVPNLPALAMAMASVMPQHQHQHQHQQPMMATPPVSMAMPTQAPPVMAMAPAAPVQHPANSNFIASFPPAQVTMPTVLHSPLLDHNSHLTNQRVLNSGDQSRWRWLPGLPRGPKGRSRRPGLYWVPGGFRWKFPHNHRASAPKQVQCREDAQKA